MALASSARKTAQGKKMDQAVYNLVCAVEECTLSTTTCVCHACYKQAARNVGKENYKVRWRPKTGARGD